jgi:hypothetical protein
LKYLLKEQSGYLKISKKTTEEMKVGVLEWQKTHDSRLAHIDSLSQVKVTIQQHEDEVMEQRAFVSNVAQTIRQLEQQVKDRNKMHEEQLRKNEQTYQSHVDGLQSKVAGLEAQATEVIEAADGIISKKGKDTSEVSANFGSLV